MVFSRLDGNFLVGWPIWGNSRRSHSFTYSELDSPVVAKFGDRKSGTSYTTPPNLVTPHMH